jgi:hypothetical protein
MVNPNSFRNSFRMNENTFELLFSMIEPAVTGSSYFRKPISVREKLSVTLRYLATDMGN